MNAKVIAWAWERRKESPGAKSACIGCIQSLSFRSSRTMSGIGDDNILRLSYYKVDVGLIDDPDIMKIMRSASAENLALPEEALPFNQVSTRWLVGSKVYLTVAVPTQLILLYKQVQLTSKTLKSLCADNVNSYSVLTIVSVDTFCYLRYAKQLPFQCWYCHLTVIRDLLCWKLCNSY